MESGRIFRVSCTLPKFFQKDILPIFFDLPFHGNHIHQDPIVVTKQLWKDGLVQFFEKENIQEFEVIGFSIGGRFALATFEAFAEKINHVMLLAPDGIKVNPLYRLATASKVGRWGFRRVIAHQPTFLKIGTALQKLGMVSKSTIRMADFMLGTPLKQKQIYYAWVGFKELQFDIPKLIHLAQRFQTNFSFFVGEI